MEEPDLKPMRDVPTQLQHETYKGKFDSEMCIQHELRASPLFFCCRDFAGLKFPLAEIRNSVNNNPGHATSEIDNLFQ